MDDEILIAITSIGAIALAIRLSAMVATAEYFRKDNKTRFDPYLQVKSADIHNAIIFLRDVPTFNPQWYARNSPNLSGNIFIPDLGQVADTELAAQFPGRKTYIYGREAASPHFVMGEVQL